MELRRYWEIIWRRKWILAQAVVVIVGGALLVSYQLTPIYKSSAHMLINTENSQSDYLSQDPVFQLPRNLGIMSYLETRNVVDTYIVLAKGSPVIGKVIKELDLRDRKGRTIEVKDFVISMPRFPKFVIKQKKGVKIRRMKAAEVLKITGYSTNREEAAKIADSVARSFSAFLSKLWQQEASSARQSIEKQLLEIELLASFSELWRKETSAVGESLEGPSPESRTKKEAVGETKDQFRTREEAIDLDNRISTLIAELADLESEKGAVQRSLQKAYSTLDDAEITSLGTRIKVLSEQIDKKNKEINKILKESGELPRFMTRLQTLGDIYDSLKSRWEYIKIAETMDISNVITVQPAALSVYPRNDIYFPKKKLVAVMSLFLCMGFGIFLCFLLEYLDDSVKTAKEINEKINQPVLGIIQKVKGRKLVKNKMKTESGFLDGFWDIVSNIKMITQNNEYKILAITSATRSEGKSVISKYLSRTFVESGRRVLLVDLNLRRPYLHEMFDLSNSTGVSHFLKGEEKIKDIIFPTTMEGLSLIPAGPKLENPLKFIDAPDMLRLIDSVKKDYDLIIFDTPAVEDGNDVAVVSSYSDNVLFVVASRYVSEDNLKKAIEIVQKTKTNVLGVILNKG